MLVWETSGSPHRGHDVEMAETQRWYPKAPRSPAPGITHTCMERALGRHAGWDREEKGEGLWGMKRGGR